MDLNWDLLLPKNLFTFFSNIILKKSFVHAYFFIGPAGANKQKTALYFAQSIFCQHNEDFTDGIPCLKCDNCKQVSKSIHPDLIQIKRLENNANITIEQIRYLNQRLSMKPLLAKYQVVIIYNVELMTDEAANSLLKNLEEPAPETIFILIANNILTVPKTIISRCQVVRFTSINKQELFNYYLKKNKETNEIDKYFSFSQGLPGFLDNYLQIDDFWLEEIEEVKQKLLKHKLPLSDKFDFIKKILLNKNLVNEKKQILQNEIEIWIKIFRDILLIKLDLKNLIRFQELLIPLEKFAKYYSIKDVLKILDQLLILNNKINYNLNSQLVLENLYLNII